MRYRLVAVCLFLLVSGIHGAVGQSGSQQNGQSAQGAPVEAVIYVQDLTPSELGNRIREILVSRISEKFRAFNLHAVAAPILVDTVESSQSDFRVQPLLAQHVPAATDLVVAAIFRVSRTSVDIQFILLDPKQKNVLGGVLSRARTGLTVFTSVDSAVNDLDPVLKEYISNRYQYQPPKGVVQQITLEGGREGAEVFFAGRDVGKVSGGTLDVPYTPFPVGSKVRVEVRKPGYHTEESVIDLSSPKVTGHLPPLHPAGRFSTGIDWTLGQSVGFGGTGRFFVSPDWTYLEMNVQRSMVSMNQTGFHDLRFYDFGASVGQYVVLSYRSPIRVTVSLGAGVIYTSLAGSTQKDFTDVYLNLLSPTLELNVYGWQLFLRPQLKFALGVGDNLLGRTWVTSSLGLPPVTIGVLRTW